MEKEEKLYVTNLVTLDSLFLFSYFFGSENCSFFSIFGKGRRENFVFARPPRRRRTRIGLNAFH